MTKQEVDYCSLINKAEDLIMGFITIIKEFSLIEFWNYVSIQESGHKEALLDNLLILVVFREDY